MGDASVLSHEYRRASELSDALNRAIVEVKKRHLASKKTASDDASTRAYLISVLRALASALSDGQSPDDESVRDVSLNLLPGAMIDRLRKTRAGTLSYFIEDLHEAADALRAGNIDSKVLEVLDTVASFADEETSRVFRRMLRK
jgi:hypothetical protein